MEKIEILGVPIDNVSMQDALLKLESMLSYGGKSAIFTPNSEIVVMAEKNAELSFALSDASMLLPDGIGIVHASKILGTPLKEKVAGCDFCSEIFKKYQDGSLKMFFLGGKPGVSELAAENLKKQYKKLNIVGVNDGYFKEDAEVIEKINELKPDILFVCLGAPKQEIWINKNKNAIDAKVFIGAGGTIDVLAGTVKRAPEFYIKHGLEWFYRLKSQPSRAFRMAKLPLFALKVLGYKLTHLKK